MMAFLFTSNIIHSDTTTFMQRAYAIFLHLQFTIYVLHFYFQLSSRIVEEKTKSSSSSSNGSMFMKKDMPKSMKMKLKGGGFVDPDSNLEHKV